MDKRTDSLLAIIAVLLFILLALNTYSLIATNQQRALAEQKAAAYDGRAQSVQAIVESQRELIFGMLDSYEADVYDNPNIDRIAEQQLIAEEYQLTTLQTIAIQNMQVIELLAGRP